MQQAARLSGGSLEQALLWCDESTIEFRRELLELLAQPDGSGQAAAKRLGQFADEAGKELAAKRDRLRVIVALAEEFYRSAAIQAEGGPAPHDPTLAPLVSKALNWLAPEAPAACLNVCLEAYERIDANVNQTTLLEWLLDELAETSRTGPLVA